MIHKNSKRCVQCALSSRKASISNRYTKIAWPAVEELLKKLETDNYSSLGRKLGVSGNAIKKHLRAAGVDPLPKGNRKKKH